MKPKRHFLGKPHYDVAALFVFWIIIHFLGWYSNGYGDFFKGQLVLITIGVTLLLSLILSSSGNNKNDFQLGLPFINSYIESNYEIKITSGGLNLFMRVFYCILAVILILSGLIDEANSSLTLIEMLLTLIFIVVILFFIIKYIRNSKDYLSFNLHTISWYDYSIKNKISIDFKNIKSFEIKTHQYKGLDYPEKIILKTPDRPYAIDLKEMSMLPFSSIIIIHLQIITEHSQKQ
jgi:hypothetical protein